eukprot:5492411-Prorocentrum_lima.AAC.1
MQAEFGCGGEASDASLSSLQVGAGHQVDHEKRRSRDRARRGESPALRLLSHHARSTLRCMLCLEPVSYTHLRAHETRRHL